MATAPKTATTTANGAKTYTVKYVVNHDGEEYPVGSEIALSEKHANPLLAVGAVSDPAADAGSEAE